MKRKRLVIKVRLRSNNLENQHAPQVMMNLKIRTRKDNSRIRAVKELQFTQ
jgi:hypothetical protein